MLRLWKNLWLKLGTGYDTVEYKNRGKKIIVIRFI